MDRKTVAVVIPVFNRARLLQRALHSVLEQSYLPKEIIVVDDGSTDNVQASISQIKKQHSKKTLAMCSLKLIHIPHCGMAGRVRNIGVYNTDADIITFLDSDDEWKKEKLQLQVPYMDSGKIVHTREIWMREGREISQKKQKHQKQGYIFEDALQKCIIGPSTVMLHRDVFSKYGFFREDLQIAEDYEFWLRITSREEVIYIDSPLVIKYDLADKLQLSKRYEYIEKFRIDALKPLVEKKIFTTQQQDIAEQMLKRKQKIWNQGREKHRC